MKWFQNMKIQKKMLVSFFVLIALLVGLAVFAIIQMNAVDTQNTYAGKFPGEREIAMLHLQSAATDLRRVVVAMTMYTPLNDITKITPLITEAATAYNLCLEALDYYEDRVNNDPTFDAAEKSTRVTKANALRENIRQYKTEICDVTEEYAKVGNYDEAVKVAAAGASIIVDMIAYSSELLEIAADSADKADKAASDTAQQANMLIIIIAVVASLFAVIVALYVASLISKPLITLSTFMKKAGATGDISLSAQDAELIGRFANTKDELGDAINGSAMFVQHVTNIAKELETIAGGDLTTDITLLSESDTMGKSLKQMITSLNNMFGEINSSTNQVSIGSKQVADGAQSLAQGSTEQAASIQQLSSSIAEIAHKTKENAVTAEQTSKLSVTIKSSAEKGSRQMDEMITSVKEINDASQSISKIIKTIDDIAFQTNILALNAAVEAARAGQHGKGFAVVAEEVRNLASKSAEAAKDTGNMIQNSMEKAELGSRIAGETAASLTEIVSGINESSKLISEIARSSEEQTTAIEQINIGIDQVAQVVQQNSATAEQSAAASEEMSSQSSVLQELIAQFRLREDAAAYRGLPPAGNYTKKVHPMAEPVSYNGGDYGKY